MKTFYEVKNIFSADFKGMIEDVDLKSRTVTGYFSRFGNKDHDGDIMMPGAFTKTISERGFESKNIIPHILDHDIHETLKQLSKPKIYEKSDGGFFESKISDTNNGIDTLKLYRDGVINQHSFGFKTLQEDHKSNHREIKEVLLYEISTVTLGANENTPFTGFKSLTPKELIDRYQVLTKAFKNGDYTDDTFAILEAQIRQLERDMVEKYLQSINAETTEPVTTTQPEAKEIAMEDIILLTVKHF